MLCPMAPYIELIVCSLANDSLYIALSFLQLWNSISSSLPTLWSMGHHLICFQWNPISSSLAKRVQYRTHCIFVDQWCCIPSSFSILWPMVLYIELIICSLDIYLYIELMVYALANRAHCVLCG